MIASWKYVLLHRFLSLNLTQSRQSMRITPVVVDPMRSAMASERDIFTFTDYPSITPSQSPSISPSSQPSSVPSTSFPSHEPSSYPSIDPTTNPSISPSLPPSSVPSVVPTKNPTDIPSLIPSYTPSIFPSQSPYPSQAPTSTYPLGHVPNISDVEEAMGYFNYNPNDDHFGPGRPVEKVYYWNTTQEVEVEVDGVTNAELNKNYNSVLSSETKKSNVVVNRTITHNVTYIDYENSTWGNVRNSDEFKYWEKFDMGRTLANRCHGATSPFRKQSPIDLCEKHVNQVCRERHQIRSRGGDYDLHDAEIQLQVLPSKLRITYASSQQENITDFQPPRADFAYNWHGYIPVIHIDIKIPSEHTICGRRFVGEYQIFFYHDSKKQPIVQSVLMEVHPTNRPHLHFQRVLNEWQAIFDLEWAKCSDRRRRALKEEARFLQRMKNSLDTIEEINQSSFADEPEEINVDHQRRILKAKHRVSNPRFEIDDKNTDSKSCPSCSEEGRKLTNSTMPTNQSSRWDPFRPRIINSLYFYGYTGSLTEPPCSEWVAWRVLDTPMQISSEQLNQLRRILFDQVDGNTCKRTSAHWNGSVARPIQSFGAGDRKLWRCTREDYVGDSEKDRD